MKGDIAIQERLTASKRELGEQMKLKKQSRDTRLIAEIKQRIKTLGEWLNPQKEESNVDKLLREEFAKNESDYVKWKHELRERYLAFVHQVDAHPNKEQAFGVTSTSEIDVLFSLLKKKRYLKEEYTLVGPKQVIAYYRNKVHHEVQRNDNRAAFDPIMGSVQPKPDQLRGGDPQERGDQAPQPELPADQVQADHDEGGGAL